MTRVDWLGMRASYEPHELELMRRLRFRRDLADGEEAAAIAAEMEALHTLKHTFEARILPLSLERRVHAGAAARAHNH